MKNIHLSIAVIIFYLILLSYGCIGKNKDESKNKENLTTKNIINDKDPLLKDYEAIIEQVFDDDSPKLIRYYDKTSLEDLKYEKKYHENGAISMEGAYKNGKRSGKWTAWYDNGVLWSTGDYINGLKDGTRKTYFNNGMLRYNIEYKNDKADGIAKFFDMEGNLVSEIKYVNDSIIYQKNYN